MPLPDFSKWSKSRQEEILCFSEYMSQFRSWIALASDVFAFEIESAIRHPDELHMGWFEASSTVEVKSFVGDVAADFYTLSPELTCLSKLMLKGLVWVVSLLHIVAQVDLRL